MELVQVAESSAVMRIAFTVGRRLPMMLGAMGRVVAARGDWSQGELRAGFDQIPWSSAPAYDAWLAEVDETRRTGVGVDRGHVNAGVLGVAVPVEPTGPLTHIIAAAMFVTDQTPDIASITERLRGVAATAAPTDGDRHA